MNGKTRRTLFAVAGLGMLFVAAAFSPMGYAALAAPVDQAVQPTATAMPVSSQGGGEIAEPLPAVGTPIATPLPVETPSSQVLPESGRGPDANMYMLLGAAALVGVALVALGLWLRSSRRRDLNRWE